MEKFITKENLPDIIRDLAEEFLKHSDRVSVTLEMVQFTHSRPQLTVRVQETERWTVIKETKFEVIDNPMDSFEVIDHMIDTPIDELNRKPNAQ